MLVAGEAGGESGADSGTVTGEAGSPFASPLPASDSGCFAAAAGLTEAGFGAVVSKGSAAAAAAVGDETLVKRQTPSGPWTICGLEVAFVAG